MVSTPLDFSTEQLDHISDALRRLRWEGEARCVLLADITGQLIEAQGDLYEVNTAVLSALAAGQISATREIARLVGEEARFKLLLHEGERQSVYLSDVVGELVLVAIFETTTPIGMVRLLTKMAVETIAEIVSVVVENRSRGRSAGAELSVDFSRLLAAELDTSFRKNG